MVLFFRHIRFVVNNTFNATPPERLQQHPLLFTTNRTDRTFFAWRLTLARPSHPGHSTILLRSEIPSGICAKPRTVAASNNRVHMPWSLYYCLFAPHICMVLFFTHIPFVVNHTFNATSPERLKHYLHNRVQYVCCWSIHIRTWPRQLGFYKSGAMCPQVRDEADTGVEIPTTGLTPMGERRFDCVVSSCLSCLAFFFGGVGTLKLRVECTSVDHTSPS